MASGLVRVAVLLCAVVTVTRAGTWHSHGKPPGTKTTIWTALAPLTHFEGKKWFGVGENGNLYERYQDFSGTWHWVDHEKPSGSDWYDSEPCAFEGEDKLHLTTDDGYLYERYWAPFWTTVNYGPLFGYNVLYASGCSSVYKPRLKYRTFMRGAVGQGSNGYLFEWFWEWGTGWRWRWHGWPVTPRGSTYVANIKTTSYLHTKNGVSFVFVVGTDGNMYRRVTHQDGWYSRWHNQGRPAGKTIRHIHATRGGFWWAITEDGFVCRRQVGWPCFSPPNRWVRDCSDPFYVGNYRETSMFCITDDASGQWTFNNRLYQLTVGWDPATATWVDHGTPFAYNYIFLDRPNVAFADTGSWPGVQTPLSVFVPSTEGVYELSFP